MSYWKNAQQAAREGRVGDHVVEVPSEVAPPTGTDLAIDAFWRLQGEDREVAIMTTLRYLLTVTGGAVGSVRDVRCFVCEGTGREMAPPTEPRRGIAGQVRRPCSLCTAGTARMNSRGGTTPDGTFTRGSPVRLRHRIQGRLHVASVRKALYAWDTNW